MWGNFGLFYASGIFYDVYIVSACNDSYIPIPLKYTILLCEICVWLLVVLSNYDDFSVILLSIGYKLVATYLLRNYNL